MTHSADTVAGRLRGLAEFLRFASFTSALPQNFEDGMEIAMYAAAVT